VGAAAAGPAARAHRAPGGVELNLGYLGLGSNVGDRRANLQAAVEDLWAHGVVVLASSSVYETEPVGEVLDQRPFFNACVRVETALEPEPLLDVCKAVERALGREPAGVRHGPRPIDVDVLLFEGVEYESERVRLPHREVTSRRFVLVPLLELEPRLEVPGYGPAARALEQITGQEVRRAEDPLDVRP
jgi:2-amino-4-hydroxy-6-hydroxymethyldihydropteridine diphosphokinase